jgi:hypothetical protein
MAATQADVSALTPPSQQDGPVRLLNCVVSATGILEAEVDSRSDDAMACDIRCNYEFAGKTLTHTFSETIPARFNGRVGRFDTSNARAGSYPGEVGACRKTAMPRDG